MNSCLPNPHLPLLPPTAVPPPPTSSAAPPTTSNMDHNTSLSSNEPQFSSPLRPADKPENGLRINYEGRVSILGHGPIYGGGNGDVSTTLDDSREERGWTSTDDQMSPKEQSSSPDAHLPKPSIQDDDEPMPAQRPTGDSLERLREICNKSLPQPGNTMIDTASNESIQADGSTLFHCHLCAFTSTSRDEFNDHVNDHYVFHCPKCDFNTKSETEYRAHLKDEHNLTPEDLDDDQGIRVPKINSQGKVKVFKCKQCEFVAVTKEDFWRHTKMHIKPEKMLNCPKCPFVTEYKHHLEYHLRNHFGSKPFKCPSCSYTCVNKSMLNSHMKSHTNIYQYRCQDCNYATKYCHSLKLHLRKYNHKPAMVLNSDGTPNPLPIIDVYGTRRGPKKKPGDENLNLSPEGAKALPLPPTSPTSPGNHPALPQAPRFPLLPPFVMAQMRAQMEMQQSLGGHGPPPGSPQRIAPPPFSRSSGDEFPSLLSSSSPVRTKNERGNSSEMEDDERSLNGNEKMKCAICDFETPHPEIYRNHMMFHASKEDSPPPIASTSLPSVTLPQYPLQIRSPLSINAGAKAAAAAAAASAFFNRERPLSSSNESESEAPSSSIKTNEEKDNGPPPLDYLDYLKKMAPLAPLLQKSINTSPNPLISSSTTGGASPPVTGATTSELISRLYFGNLMSKNLSQTFNPVNPLAPLPSNQSQKPTQTPSNLPVADSSSGALDLSQLNKGDSPMPSRPQSGSQTSTQSGSSKSRRKGKAYKIERKLVLPADATDRDSLNSGQSEYSNEQDMLDEAKSDGSAASKEVSGLTSTSLGTNGDHASNGNDNEASHKPLSGNYVCKYCDIAFSDSIMYSIHMGYHGFQNPFKCNYCGKECGDKVEFFLHTLSCPKSPIGTNQ